MTLRGVLGVITGPAGRWVFGGIVAAGLVVAGYAIGVRRSAPESMIVTEYRETFHAYRRVDSSHTTDVQTVDRWRIKIVTSPDGTREETREGEATRKEATKTATTSTESLDSSKGSTVRQVTAPRYMVGAIGTVNTSGKFGYGPLLGMRIAGPAWLTVAADVPNRTAIAGLSVKF